MSSTVTAREQQDKVAQLPVWTVSLLVLMAVVDSQAVAAIAPQIAVGLAAAKTTVAGSVMAYSVAAAAAAFLLGKYSRRIDSHSWLPAAAGLLAIANILAAIAPHVYVFFAARALAGMAGGLISALAIAALANASSYARRGNQMSGVAISYFLAPIVGVPSATFLTGLYGWRVVFGGCALLVLLAGLLVQRLPLPVASAQPATVDTRKPLSLWQLASRSRATLMGVIGAFFVSGGLVGFTTYLGSWLSDAFNAGTREVGFVYALAGIGAVVGGALGGMLADRFGKSRVAVRSSIGMAIALVLLPTFIWGGVLLFLIAAAAFLAALRVAPLQALVTEQVAAEERAPYIALRNVASQIGIAAAAAVGGRLYGSLGMSGVGLLCAIFTTIAWISIHMLNDPQSTSPAKSEMVVRSTHPWLYRIAGAVVVLALVVCLILPWLASFLLTKAWTRPDERARHDTPAALGAEYKEVSFTSVDGNRLSGWYLPSRSEHITIVMSHGLFRSRYEMLERGVALWQLGYGVLLYDLRRHGNSPAEFSTLGFAERKDVLAAANFARTQAPTNKIVLMGVSMGAAATLLAAAETTDIMAVISESSFLSFTDVVYHHMTLGKIPVFPFAPLLVWITASRMSFSPADFNIQAAVGKISRPILFIGGGNDVRMPNERVLEPLYETATHPLKAKLVVPDARHGQAYGKDPVAYQQAVQNFLRAVAASQ
ncbi:MAG: MFS transporter [Acidobacteriota bacterium]